MNIATEATTAIVVIQEVKDRKECRANVDSPDISLKAPTWAIEAMKWMNADGEIPVGVTCKNKEGSMNKSASLF